VEPIVATFLVCGLAAVVVRFIARNDAGQVVLPRVVDDSIGMWAIRRLVGSAQHERPSDGLAVMRRIGNLPVAVEAARGPTRPLNQGAAPGPAPFRLQAVVRPAAAVGSSPRAYRVEYSAERLRAIGVVRPTLDDRGAVAPAPADRRST